MVARRRAMDLHPPQRPRWPASCRCSLDDATAPEPGRRGGADVADIPDDRLRLIFTCCHPALARRRPGGADPAAAVRADHRRSGPRVPGLRADHGGPDHPRQEEDRRRPHPVPGSARRRAAEPGSSAVLDVVHLLFTTGHTAPAGDVPAAPRPGRAGPRPGPHAAPRSCPTSPTSPGCSPSSCSPTPAAHTRITADGRLLLLAEQDRTRWDRAEIGEGLALVRCRPAAPAARAATR